MLLTKSALLEASDLRNEDVDVPEWGGSIRLAMMSGAMRDEFFASMRDAEGKFDTRNYSARVIAFCAVDDAGARIFAPEDIPALAAKSAEVLDRVALVAMKLNRINNGAVEEAEKN